MALESMGQIGIAAGLVGLYLCFPDRPRRMRIAGVLLAVAGLVLAAAGLIRWFGWPAWPAFAIPAGLVAVACAGRMIAHPHPVYCAVYLGGVVICAVVLALLAGAEFLAAALLIVYAGAILVAYVFVIMLAQRSEMPEYDRNVRSPGLAVLAGLVMLSGIVSALQRSAMAKSPVQPDASAGSNVAGIGAVLFGDYAVVIEIAGALLLVAMVGAIVLATMRIRGGAR